MNDDDDQVDLMSRPHGDLEAPRVLWPRWCDEHWESNEDSGPIALTERQAEVIQSMARLQQEHGVPPTLRELGQALGVKSGNGVMGHLIALRRKGWLQQRRPNQARSFVFKYARVRPRPLPPKSPA